MDIHVVVSGETIDTIAGIYNISSEKIIFDNQLVYPYRLTVGQALFISDGQISPVKNLHVNGYAYPFISRWVLENTLPYLTEISVFSYGFTPDGRLLYPALSVDWIVQAARLLGTRAILTLTPFDEMGRFNNLLISSLINNSGAVDNLINNLLIEIRGKGYMGVDIDFEYILANDRDLFTEFVRRVTEGMNQEGYTCSVALAPKTSAMQTGLLYEGKDYGGLGAAANRVLLMTYEWGYTYSMPMAVAPIDKVTAVIDYALTEIPVSKISMGIPNYGYDWPLPYVSGETRAKTIGNIEAVRLAIDYGAEIKFDEVAMTPYFNYINNGEPHEVWFEDVRSIKAKLDLVIERNLSGVGYWQIMQFFRANWLLIQELFYIEGK